MKTVLWVAAAGFLGVGLAWLIFSPQPGKDVGLESGTSIDAGWTTYRSELYGFEVQYPPAYSVDETHGNGIAFYVPTSMADRTNLASDSYISVERISEGECEAKRFLEEGEDVDEKDPAQIGDREFFYAESMGAAAGNVYEQHVYAIPSPSVGCAAVRLFLHYARIENYEPGQVIDFDREGMIKTARDMAGTLVVR